SIRCESSFVTRSQAAGSALKPQLRHCPLGIELSWSGAAWTAGVWASRGRCFFRSCSGAPACPIQQPLESLVLRRLQEADEHAVHDAHRVPQEAEHPHAAGGRSRTGGLLRIRRLHRDAFATAASVASRCSSTSLAHLAERRQVELAAALVAEEAEAGQRQQVRRQADPAGLGLPAQAAVRVRSTAAASPPMNCRLTSSSLSVVSDTVSKTATLGVLGETDGRSLVRIFDIRDADAPLQQMMQNESSEHSSEGAHAFVPNLCHAARVAEPHDDLVLNQLIFGISLAKVRERLLLSESSLWTEQSRLPPALFRSEFTDFVSSLGIKHRRTSLYCPQKEWRIREVQRLHQDLSVRADALPVKQVVQELLLANRSSEHALTNNTESTTDQEPRRSAKKRQQLARSRRRMRKRNTITLTLTAAGTSAAAFRLPTFLNRPVPIRSTVIMTLSERGFNPERIQGVSGDKKAKRLCHSSAGWQRPSLLAHSGQQGQSRGQQEAAGTELPRRRVAQVGVAAPAFAGGHAGRGSRAADDASRFNLDAVAAADSLGAAGDGAAVCAVVALDGVGRSGQKADGGQEAECCQAVHLLAKAESQRCERVRTNLYFTPHLAKSAGHKVPGRKPGCRLTYSLATRLQLHLRTFLLHLSNKNSLQCPPIVVKAWQVLNKLQTAAHLLRDFMKTNLKTYLDSMQSRPKTGCGCNQAQGENSQSDGELVIIAHRPPSELPLSSWTICLDATEQLPVRCLGSSLLWKRIGALLATQRCEATGRPARTARTTRRHRGSRTNCQARFIFEVRDAGLPSVPHCDVLSCAFIFVWLSASPKAGAGAATAARPDPAGSWWPPSHIQPPEKVLACSFSTCSISVESITSAMITRPGSDSQSGLLADQDAVVPMGRRAHRTRLESRLPLHEQAASPGTAAVPHRLAAPVEHEQLARTVGGGEGLAALTVAAQQGAHSLGVGAVGLSELAADAEAAVHAVELPGQSSPHHWLRHRAAALLIGCVDNASHLVVMATETRKKQLYTATHCLPALFPSTLPYQRSNRLIGLPMHYEQFRRRRCVETHRAHSYDGGSEETEALRLRDKLKRSPASQTRRRGSDGNRSMAAADPARPRDKMEKVRTSGDEQKNVPLQSRFRIAYCAAFVSFHKRHVSSASLSFPGCMVPADQVETKLKEKEDEMTKKEEEMGELQKKFSQLQQELDTAQESLAGANTNLEATEKRANDAEAEVQALTRRIRLIEEDLEQTETRLTEATQKLEEASKAADESERGRKVLENRSIADDERINTLEEQLKEAKYIAEDADRKYDEAARKLAITRATLSGPSRVLRAPRGDEAAKILELEEELRVVGSNMKSLEISEQEAAQREESYEETIRDLSERLKTVRPACMSREKDIQKTYSRMQLG
uniref:WD_REPEATS_REGION domain-containing protein n=1 Tax=Macrostomum lignano TaxID=282301 RepID=A0A1I8I8G6_9PLAT